MFVYGHNQIVEPTVQLYRLWDYERNIAMHRESAEVLGKKGLGGKVDAGKVRIWRPLCLQFNASGPVYLIICCNHIF